ncbi:MAG TPA: DUF4124 domain-containing protein [Myxococcota bacterium]|nr:DUF4124 domain-containing protein [Myxococcota bacterium]
MKARAGSAVVALALFASVGLAFAGLAAREARAQAYKYKDEQGHVHFTENLYDIPEKYRAKLETREMPTRVDPNEAAKQGQNDAIAETSVEDTVRQVRGKDLTIKQQDALAKWWKTYGWTWVIVGGVAFLAHLVIHFSMVIHAFLNKNLGWGLSNLLLGVTSPFYLMTHLEQPIGVRLGLLFIYLAPGVILGVVLSQVTALLT